VTELVAFVAQGLRISTPYALAALGGSLSERAGVVNLGLEGMLLAGAFAATCGSHLAGSGAGAVAGALGGLCVAAVYAVAVLRARADQVVAGVALNLLVLGLTRYLLKLVFHSASSSPAVPGLGGPGTGVYVVATGLAVVAAQVWLARTPGGLRLRAVGEHPEAAHSLGVDVVRARLGAILASGILAGLGGAWLALDNHGFVDRMSGGRGYIAVAAVILGRWSPLGAAAACLLFGFADAAQLQLQTRVTFLPRELVQVLPYLVTLLVLAGLAGRARPPAALGRPWGGASG
jgi:general nucleoside transport system permease protein